MGNNCITGIDCCDCTIEYSEEKMSGQSTQMDYFETGKFKCPKCGFTLDLSKDTFKLQVKISKEEGVEIVSSEKDIDKNWFDDKSYCIIRECLEEDLNCMPYNWDWAEKHAEGNYEVHLYHKDTQYMTDCGTEYDVEADILFEKELGAD